MEKILVTGANGFVGTALCRVLRARGIDFVPAVRSAAGPDQIAVGDIDAQTQWKAALSACSAVIHLAARVHVMNDPSVEPLAAYRALNCDATLNLARQAAESGIKRFVYVSSIKVNGEKTNGKPFTPADIPAPLDPYGKSKWEAEIGLKALSRQTGLEVVVVRPPLVYGPGVGANFLSLMRLVRAGLPLPLGAVDNRRSMVAADNLADLLICCTRHSSATGETFLVSDGCDVSTPELVRKLAAAMAKPVRLLPIPEKFLTAGASLLGKAAMAERLLGSLQVDIARTKAVLGWRPVVGMDDAIDATVKHFLSGA
jgi:UDP-glucose 4-epimerase